MVGETIDAFDALASDDGEAFQVNPGEFTLRGVDKEQADILGRDPELGFGQAEIALDNQEEQI
jgi:hypothetical protein